MNLKKRILSLFIALLLIFTALAGCSNTGTTTNSATPETSGTTSPTEKATSDYPAYLNEKGFPIVKEPITLNAMVAVHPTQGEYASIMVWKEYEKMTGIKIIWDEVPMDNISEKLSLSLASGKLPDIYYRCKIPDKDITKYGDEGVFIELNTLIDKYGENFKQVMESVPQVKKGLPAYNGKIYTLPEVSISDPVDISPKLFINSEWMKKVNGKMPTTTEEFYQLMKSFKDNDANNNGIADEIPLCATRLRYLLDFFKGQWGLMNRGKPHENVDMDEKTGKLRFIPSAPEFKQMLAEMNRFYRDGLIYNEVFTINSTKFLALGEDNLVGAFPYTNTSPIGSKNGDNYVGLTAAIKGPNGDQMWSAKRASLPSRGAFAITKANKYPEATMKWIDYFYGDEGVKMYFMGIEGVTYQKTADGKYEFLDSITKNIPEGSSFDQVIGKYVPYGGGSLPTITKTEYFQGGEVKPIPLKAALDMAPYTPKELWGPFSYTLEENDRIVALESDILSYVDQMIPQFIQGKASLDKDWDNYIAQLNKMGLEEYMSLYTKAYERYSQN